MDKILIEILGRNAFNNDMQVDDDVMALVKTVRYLATQLKITERWCEDEGKHHIEEVLENAKELLMTK